MKTLPPNTIAIVCGSREIQMRGYEIVLETLDVLWPSFVIQGGAASTDPASAGSTSRRWPIAGWVSVDSASAVWARKRGVPCAEVKAQWGELGPKAGPLRNGWMLRLKPDIVIAFPGGKGTANMVAQAIEAGVEVLLIKNDGNSA